MSYPREWRSFCRWHRENEMAIPSQLSRFAARYRLASSFHGVQLTGYPDKTSQAYATVIQTFLAYTALEQLHTATRSNPKQHLHERWGTLSHDSAAKLRQSPNLIWFLHDQMHHKGLKQNLQNFVEGENDNALYVATALRHAVSHGFMTVHPRGTRPQVAIQFCQDISQMLLKIADDEFAEIAQAP
ncbi:MAG: hypothetical protein ACO331_14600 [Prochlorothrix sp.]